MKADNGCGGRIIKVASHTVSLVVAEQERGLGNDVKPKLAPSIPALVRDSRLQPLIPTHPYWISAANIAYNI